MGRGRPVATVGRVTRHPVAVFLLVSFSLSWAWSGALIVAGETVTKDPWPTHLPALAGPALAAFAAAALTGHGRELWASVTRWRIGARWWLVALSPLLLGAVVLLVTGADTGELGRFSGTAHGLGWVVLACVYNGFGEEIGWRGFLLARLQPRWGARRATALVAAAWAAWHLPFFFLLASYADFTLLQLPGFLLGMLAGAFVLTWLYDRTGASVPAVALWHASYNLAVATGAGGVAVAATVTAAVMVWAVYSISRLGASPQSCSRR